LGRLGGKNVNLPRTLGKRRPPGSSIKSLWQSVFGDYCFTCTPRFGETGKAMEGGRSWGNE